jgi:hypothetical protein
MVDCDYERLNQRVVVFGQHSVEGVLNTLGISTLAFRPTGCDQERLDEADPATCGGYGIERSVHRASMMLAELRHQKGLHDGNRLPRKHGIQRFFYRSWLTGPFWTSCANQKWFSKAEPGFRCDCRCWFFN